MPLSNHGLPKWLVAAVVSHGGFCGFALLFPGRYHCY
jgi:hypothetical protein